LRWLHLQITLKNAQISPLNFPSNSLSHISLWEPHSLWTTIYNIFMFLGREFVVECLQKLLVVVYLTYGIPFQKSKSFVFHMWNHSFKSLLNWFMSEMKTLSPRIEELSVRNFFFKAHGHNRLIWSFYNLSLWVSLSFYKCFPESLCSNVMVGGSSKFSFVKGNQVGFLCRDFHKLSPNPPYTIQIDRL